MTNSQLWLTMGVPSLLVILTWLHNNTRLNRLETAFDGLNRRMDDAQRRMDDLQRGMLDLQRGMHNDMLTFQAAILGELSTMKERVAVLEVGR